MRLPRGHPLDIEWWQVIWAMPKTTRSQPMPWTFTPDDDLDSIRRVRTMAEGHAARLDDIVLEMTAGAGSAATPDLVKSVGRQPRPSFAPVDPRNRDLAEALVRLYPDDVASVERLHELREIRTAELNKAVPSQPAGSLPDAMRGFGGSETGESIVAFAVGRGMLPLEPDATKAAPGFVGGASKRTSDFHRDNALAKAEGDGKAQLSRELAILKNLATLNLDSGTAEYTLDLAIAGGSLTHAKTLQAVAETESFSPALRQKAGALADKARRQKANAQGRPFIDKGQF